MARKANEVVKIEDESMSDLIPFDQAPDYLDNGDKQIGLESLGQDDFKIPRIKLIQTNNPELQVYPGKAIPSEFWHTTGKISLGTSFRFIPCIASKRVILFAPQNSSMNGMLAFSKDALNWSMGANKRFEIKVDKIPNKLIWETGKNVKDSALLEWGSFNPQDEESGPAAQLSYEYLIYLPDYPELSPVVMGCFRTALANAKSFNTSMLAIRKPIQSLMVECKSSAESKGTNTWFVPNFELKGYALKAHYDAAKMVADKQKDYETTYDEAAPNSEEKPF